MNGLLEHLQVSLRLHLRNKMALLYGYLFPLIFLIAFWVLYRHERVPLLRHMGELFTVAVLGGACFGLPTALVSERERGVWRRYRLAPLPTWMFILSTIVARYLIVLSAGVLQLIAALAIGMTLPAHPLELFVAFTAVTFAFIGLGLVIAMLADNVPAVQALGQCIFLPMLIIGGVAVPLGSLPDWALHVSAFFPGRYAVEALQACVNGPGIVGTRFSIFALVVIGAAGCLAGAKLFRWDAQQRFLARTGKAWLVPVFAAWLAVGLLAEKRGRIKVPPSAPEAAVPVTPQAPTPAVAPPNGTGATPTLPINVPPPSPPIAQTDVAPVVRSATSPAPTAPPAKAAKPEPAWMKITEKEIAALDFNLPPDEGIVAPFAAADEEVDSYLKDQIEFLRRKLATWPPGDEEDDVQRVRNIVAVAGVPDAIQLPVERYLPPVVFDHLQSLYPREKLVKILTWIAQHPEEGVVIDSIADLGIEGQAGDPNQVRERVYFYAMKFIARLTGKKTE